MTAEFEEMKKILSKKFCFMEWHRIDAEARGEETMNLEDLQKIRSFNEHLPLLYISNLVKILPKGEKITRLEIEEGLNEAKKEKRLGISVNDNLLYIEHMDILNEKKLYKCYDNSLGCSFFFFEEEHQIIHNAGKIKNLIGDISGFVTSNII